MNHIRFCNKINKNRNKEGDFLKKYNNKANVIGSLLTKYRKQKGLSKEEVCRRVQLYGIDINRVELYRMEKEISIVKDFELIVLCKVLGIDYDKEIKTLIE